MKFLSYMVVEISLTKKVLRNYGRTDGRTDGTTDRCKPVYPPLFQSGGIIMMSTYYFQFLEANLAKD